MVSSQQCREMLAHLLRSIYRAVSRSASANHFARPSDVNSPLLVMRYNAVTLINSGVESYRNQLTMVRRCHYCFRCVAHGPICRGSTGMPLHRQPALICCCCNAMQCNSLRFQPCNGMCSNATFWTSKFLFPFRFDGRA